MRLGDPHKILLHITPEYVMPLRDDKEKRSAVEEKK